MTLRDNPHRISTSSHWTEHYSIWWALWPVCAVSSKTAVREGTSYPTTSPVPLEGTDKGIALRGFCVCFEKCSFVSVSVSLCVSQALCTLSYNDNDVIELNHILRNWIESYNTLILHAFESRWEQILFCGFKLYCVRVTVSLTSLSLALTLAFSSYHHKSTEKKIPLLPSLLLSFPPSKTCIQYAKKLESFLYFYLVLLSKRHRTLIYIWQGTRVSFGELIFEKLCK